MHNFPEGTYDFHLHPAPDIVARRFDDDEIARRLIAAKMKGCVIKAHHGDTSARAKLMEKRYPCLHIGGGVTLNHAVGGLNPRAVEVCCPDGRQDRLVPYHGLPRLSGVPHGKTS